MYVYDGMEDEALKTLRHEVLESTNESDYLTLVTS